MFRQTVTMLVVAVGVAGAAMASSPSDEPPNAPAATWLMNVHEQLYAGHTAAAAAVAIAQMTTVPNDDQARFAVGAIQFLQAIERLGQQLHRYGLRSAESDFAGLLPIVRLPIPPNGNPDRLTYEKFRDVLSNFVGDLQVAEATLGGIESEQVVFPLNIGLIRLDLDGDGTGTDNEALWRIFNVVSGARLSDEQARSLLVYFDRADVLWLRAYCHLLAAIAEFPLVYDWREAFMATFHGLFPNSEALFTGSDEAFPADIADQVAFIHLMHWRVIEPQYRDDILDHLEALVRLSRQSWRVILVETDDLREWIPSPTQTGVLPQMHISQRQVQGWQQFLDEFQAILEGRKLIPHWRYRQGVNLRRCFLESDTFDLVLLIQGSAAISCLEDGESSDGNTWTQITQLLGGDFFRYFVWLN